MILLVSDAGMPETCSSQHGSPFGPSHGTRTENQVRVTRITSSMVVTPAWTLA